MVLWPTCGEATIQYRPATPQRPPGQEPSARGRARDKSARQSASRIRRYTVHNALGFMPTLTFRHEPESLRGVEAACKDFARKLIRAGIDGPYLWVPERGSKNDRLHVHWLCSWWRRLGAVEVCERCASSGLRKVRSDIPPAGSLCIGCLWGHGFVGAPSEAVGDPLKAAGYVSKYVSKELVGLVDFGRHRYHVARGHQPEPVRATFWSFQDAYLGLMGHQGNPTDLTALHEVVEDWDAPMTWALRFDLERGRPDAE